MAQAHYASYPAAWVVVDANDNELARVQSKEEGDTWLRVAYGDSYAGERVVPLEEFEEL